MAKGIKLIAFDLDGTVWSPDMYQLWGGGSPFHVIEGGFSELRDKNGNRVYLLGIIGNLLNQFRADPIWAETKIAWVSCTDEPTWADECLRKFRTTPDGIPIGEIAHSSQIYQTNKQTHFKRLQKEFPDIAYHEMLFFDNESYNIDSVSRLGVRCVYCPEGMTQEAWTQGLQLFEE